MTAEWLRCSLVLEGVVVENPLQCCLCQFDDVYASGCRTASGMMSVSHTKLESFTNANDLSVIPWLFPPFTWGMFKDKPVYTKI